MATDTFSIGITGAEADSKFQLAKQLKIGDSVCQSAGDEQQAMQLGTAFLVLMPDGSKVWHTFDAERSIPGGQLVFKRLY
jgi:hypothetical protein